MTQNKTLQKAYSSSSIKRCWAVLTRPAVNQGIIFRFEGRIFISLYNSRQGYTHVDFVFERVTLHCPTQLCDSPLDKGRYQHELHHY